MEEKVCIRCGRLKPINEFYFNRSKSNPNKRRPECIVCARRKSRANQHNRSEYMRKYSEKRPALCWYPTKGSHRRANKVGYYCFYKGQRANRSAS